MPKHRLSSYWSSSLQSPRPRPRLHRVRPHRRVKPRKAAAAASRTTAAAGIRTCPSSILTLALPPTPERTFMRASPPPGCKGLRKVAAKARARAKECAWRKRNRRPCLPPATSWNPNSSRKTGKVEDTAVSPAHPTAHIPPATTRPTAANKARALTAWAHPLSPAPRRPRRLLPSTPPHPPLLRPRPPLPPQLTARTARQLRTARPHATGASSTRRRSWTSQACWPSRCAPRSCWSRTPPPRGRSPSSVSTPISSAR